VDAEKTLGVSQLTKNECIRKPRLMGKAQRMRLPIAILR
jgi:hypothetical protein